jgi:hypothetical protein
MLVAHACIFEIDHVEQGRVEPPEAAPVETADYEQDQGKPQCIQPQALSLFYSSSIFYL